MASILSAPMMQVFTCKENQHLNDVKQKHHAAMEHKIDVVSKDNGAAGSFVLWTGENAFKAMLAAGEFHACRL